MGVQGLADGFLAGFQTMDGYYRGQKADARADKELGLRDLQVHQGIEDSNRNFDLRKKGFDYGIETDKRDFKYRQGQDAINNTQQDKTIAISQGHLGLAQAANRRSDEAFKLQQEKEKRFQWTDENGPGIKVALSKLQNGEQLSEAENQLLNHPYAAKYNPFKVFGNPDFHSSIQTIMGKASALAKNPEAMVWDRSKLRSEINTPEVRSALGTVLQSQLDQGIGTVGQFGTVKSYGPPELIPTHRGTFIIQAPVTYVDDNGNETTKDAPITEGRSADGKAKVMEYTPQQLVNYFGPPAQVNSSISKNPEQWDTWSQAAGLSEPPDWKGYRQAVVRAQSEAQKNISEIQRDDMMPQDQKQQAIAAEREAANSQVVGLRDVYGIKDRSGQSTSASKSASAPDLNAQVTKWVTGDQGKATFINKLVNKQGESAVQALITNGQLEAAYQAYQQQGQAAKQETHAQRLIDVITGSRQKPKEVDENGEAISPY
jgi:hypothetical protein